MSEYRKNMDKLIEKTRKIAWEWYEKYNVPVKEAIGWIWYQASQGRRIHNKMFLTETTSVLKVKLYKDKVIFEVGSPERWGIIDRAYGGMKFVPKEEDLIAVTRKYVELYIARGFDDFTKEMSDKWAEITKTTKGSRLMNITHIYGKFHYERNEALTEVKRNIVKHLLEVYWPEALNKMVIYEGRTYHDFGLFVMAQRDKLTHFLADIYALPPIVYIKNGEKICGECPFYPECVRVNFIGSCKLRPGPDVRVNLYLLLKKIYRKKYQRR